MSTKKWRVEATVTQWHVQHVEAATAEEAWEAARKHWSNETCQEWDEIEMNGDPEEIEEEEE
jgi:hypothetical protein